MIYLKAMCFFSNRELFKSHENKLAFSSLPGQNKRFTLYCEHLTKKEITFSKVGTGQLRYKKGHGQDG